jgi:phage recombination protein Bet
MVKITLDEMHQVVGWTPEQIKAIKHTVAKGVTDAELLTFLCTARKWGLDPLTRQIYCIKRRGDDAAIIQTSIDGLRLIAEQTEKYAGQLGPWWCSKDGEWRKDGAWRDVWFHDEPPMAAKVGVIRKNFDEPIYAVAKYSSYVQLIWDTETGTMRPNAMWSKMPDVMLARCAEALAFRKAFPKVLYGIYTDDEMGQAANMVIEAEARSRMTVGTD